MKKVLSLVLALACVLSLSVVSFAKAGELVYDSDGELIDDLTYSYASRQIKGDPVEPASTFYVKLADYSDAAYINEGDNKFTLEDMVDTGNFKFNVDKDDGAKLIKRIYVKEDKKLGDMDRTTYLVFELNDVTDTDEHKATGTITFKAKNYKLENCKPGSKTETSGANSSKWEDKFEVSIDYNLWISNVKQGNDDNPGVGDRVYMDPDNRAALKFEADDDAKKFYARLSTSNMSDIYAEYGDPVDADLWFYDFVGHPTVPATSKATLTLGIPWDEDEDYTPDPENCFIYEVDADGYLVDVTSKFSYSEDDEEIPGWSIRTRQLGTYIVSDTELDVTVDEPETSEPADVETPTNNGKDIPNTGSSDMVNVALVAAVVSLAAAGAVAFRKVK